MTMSYDALVPLIDRQYQRFGRETPLADLLLTRTETPSSPIRSVYRPSFCVVVQGAKLSMLGETAYPLKRASGAEVPEA